MPLSLGAIICFIPVQRYINEVYESTFKPQYTGWTTGHIVCLVVGLLLWIVVILSTIALMLAGGSAGTGAGAAGY